MLRRFTIETSCENNATSQKLYVVMKVDSSWHLYPEYALIGIYTSKEVAIKVAREQVESIEKTNNWIIENDLFDSDDCLNALGVMESWASHTGLMFCNGLGIGGSDQFYVSDAGFENRHLKEGMCNVMTSLIQGSIFPSLCVSMGNRMLYRRNMENMHHAKMEENGVEPDTWNARIARLFRSSNAQKQKTDENISESKLEKEENVSE